MLQANAILGRLTLVTILFAQPLLADKQEAWVEVRSPNFIVFSNAGEKEARKTAIRFEKIRAVFRNSLSYNALREANSKVVRLVLPAQVA